MIGLIEIRERGSTPRRLRREMTRHLKETWRDTALHFHEHMRLARFTDRHAREAGYAKRKGENLPRGSKRFNRSYFGRKLRGPQGGGPGRALPLFYSGRAMRGSRQVKVTTTRSGARLRYPAMRVLNFRHPNSQINKAAEFRRIPPREARELAGVHDDGLDRRIDRDSSVSTERLV